MKRTHMSPPGSLGSSMIAQMEHTELCLKATWNLLMGTQRPPSHTRTTNTQRTHMVHRSTPHTPVDTETVRINTHTHTHTHTRKVSTSRLEQQDCVFALESSYTAALSLKHEREGERERGGEKNRRVQGNERAQEG